MGVPPIPLEIVTRILDETSLESIKPTLCAVALASRTFRVEAQRALFFDPGFLHIGDPDQHHNRFIDAILSSPDRLVLLVRTYRPVAVAEGPLANVWVPYFYRERKATEQENSERCITVTNVALKTQEQLKYLHVRAAYHGVRLEDKRF